EKQEEAVRFLLDQYRAIPTWLENDELGSKLNIVRKQYQGMVRRIVTPSDYIEQLYYSSFRGNLINDGKLMFLLNSELENQGKEVYTVNDLFDDIRQDTFKETINGESLNYYRRLFQNVYVSWLMDENHLDQTIAPVSTIGTSTPVNGTSLCSFDYQYELSQIPAGYRNKDVLVKKYAESHDLYFQMMDLGRFDKKAIIESYVLAEVKKVKQIIEKAHRKVHNEQDKAHYDYLLRRINVFLNVES
ncbi:MAG: zinc-dependent metalloprotease, partial [Balneolaceae bacterium]|nr:zinc-dependent metalloprotease [Balneolaceae bacterium]